MMKYWGGGALPWICIYRLTVKVKTITIYGDRNAENYTLSVITVINPYTVLV